jgi:ESCRT-I complex subunit TSG101
MALRSAVHAKLHSGLQSYETRHQAECAQLTALNNDLQQGEPAILDEMARLETVKQLCLHVGDRYQAAVDSIRGNIEVLRAKDLGDVDDILCSTTVVYNQFVLIS